MNPKIVLIEDQEDILFILERWLRDAGYSNVHCYSRAQSALAHADQCPDLLISDICLPDMDGIDLVAKLRARGCSPAVLLMTGNLNTNVTLRALEERVDGFLAKPMKREAFLEKTGQVLRLLEQNRNHRRHERVLAIGAHPDDVEIGCGGTLLKHRDAGDDLCILTLSNGRCGGNEDVRFFEAKAASQILGARLVVANLEDTKISEGVETIQVISDVIRDFDPTIIYTHSIHDNHQDHRNTYRATVVSARGVPELHSYQSPSATIDFMPSRFVDVGEQLPEKLALIDCYGSQRSKCRYLENSLITSTAEYWGRFAGFAKVEPLEVVRSI